MTKAVRAVEQCVNVSEMQEVEGATEFWKNRMDNLFRTNPLKIWPTRDTITNIYIKVRCDQINKAKDFSYCSNLLGSPYSKSLPQQFSPQTDTGFFLKHLFHQLPPFKRYVATYTIKSRLLNLSFKHSGSDPQSTFPESLVSQESQGKKGEKIDVKIFAK